MLNELQRASLDRVETPRQYRSALVLPRIKAVASELAPQPLSLYNLGVVRLGSRLSRNAPRAKASGTISLSNSNRLPLNSGQVCCNARDISARVAPRLATNPAPTGSCINCHDNRNRLGRLLRGTGCLRASDVTMTSTLSCTSSAATAEDVLISFRISISMTIFFPST